MGKHTAQPPNSDILHKSIPIVRTRTHVFLVFCKHTILELPAGMLAILIFESNRQGWLHLVGSDPEVTDHAIRTIQFFL
jgi:hypothetical protein